LYSLWHGIVSGQRLAAQEGYRMDRDLVEKARDGRLKALEKLSYRHSIDTNVLPLVPRSAAQQTGNSDDLRTVFRDHAAIDPSTPLATGQ